MKSIIEDRPAHVTVWRIGVAAHAPGLPALRALLSADERARADRLLRHADGVRAIVARGCLRLLLGEAAGIAPQDLSFVYGPRGKPALAPPASGVHFNVSHSGDVVLVALSSDCPVLGVDVEEVRTLPDAGAMADHVLSPRERAVYASLPDNGRPAAFFRAWTCKEALVKATGDGLALGLAHFEVTLAPGEAPRVLAAGGDAGAAAAWRLVPVEVRSGYAGALAVKAPRAVLHTEDLAP